MTGGAIPFISLYFLFPRFLSRAFSEFRPRKFEKARQNKVTKGVSYGRHAWIVLKFGRGVGLGGGRPAPELRHPNSPS